MLGEISPLLSLSLSLSLTLSHSPPFSLSSLSLSHTLHIHMWTTVGNKNDCPEKKVVNIEDAQKFAEQIGIQLFETSAKDNINVEEVRCEI